MYSVNLRSQALEVFQRLVVADHNKGYAVKLLAIFLHCPNNRGTLSFRGTPITFIRDGGSAQKTNRTHRTVLLFLLHHRAQFIHARARDQVEKPAISDESKSGNASTQDSTIAPTVPALFEQVPASTQMPCPF